MDTLETNNKIKTLKKINKQTNKPTDQHKVPPKKWEVSAKE